MNEICPDCNCYIVGKRAHKKYCSAKVSLCEHCLSMTHTIVGKCGKCNEEKK